MAGSDGAGEQAEAGRPPVGGIDQGDPSGTLRVEQMVFQALFNPGV